MKKLHALAIGVVAMVTGWNAYDACNGMKSASELQLAAVEASADNTTENVLVGRTKEYEDPVSVVCKKCNTENILCISDGDQECTPKTCEHVRDVIGILM